MLPLRLNQFLFAAVTVLIVAAVVRLAVHDFFGLDGDDMFSLLVAANAPGKIISLMMSMQLDVHPPLHFLILKGWIALTGNGLLALRSMNLLLDLPIGALLMRLTGQSLGRRAALIAGVLWALCPVLIFADYLVRMYTMLALWSTAGLACIVQAQRVQGLRRIGWLVGAALFALIAVYTQIIGVLVLGVLLATILAQAILGRLRPREALAGVVSFGLAGLLSLPYLLPAWSALNADHKLGPQFSFYAFDSPLDVPGTVIAVLLTDRLLNTRIVLLALVPLFAVLTVLVWRRFGKRSAVIVIGFWTAIIALTAMIVVGHLYKTFYLAPFAPYALALVAGMVLLLPRRELRGGVLVAFCLLVGAGTLNDLDHTARDDPYAAAQFIEAHERPGDVILVAPDWAKDLFAYHYRGQLPIIGPFPGISPSMDLDGLLPVVTQGYRGVWIVRFQVPAVDPNNLLDGWFSRHAAYVTKVYPFNIPVSYYELAPQMIALPDYARPLDALFGELVALRGVYIPVTTGSARDTRLHPPSNWVQVVLYWESLKTGGAFQPRVRITNEIGQVFGSELSAPDDADLWHRMPVNTWQPGQIWQAISMVNLNPTMPPGVYNVEVMVLDPATNQPISASGKDSGSSWVIAGHFTVNAVP